MRREDLPKWRTVRDGVSVRRRTFLLLTGGVAAATAGCADEDGDGDFDPIDAGDLEEYREDADEADETTDDGQEPSEGGEETPETSEGSSDDTGDGETEPPEAETPEDSGEEGTETPESETETPEQEAETPEEENETPEEETETPEEETETPDLETETPEEETETPEEEETETPEEEPETPEEETETPEEETETPEEDTPGEGGDDDGTTDDSEDESDADDDGDEEEEEDDGEGQGIDPDHPSAQGIGQSPVRGPSPSAAQAVIVAFDDPSCPNCAEFEQGAYRELRSHMDAGELSYVWRGIPSTAEWAETAILALWATYDRSESAFWELKSHLFSRQGSLSEGSVLDEVVSFLDGTGVDAEAVRSDVENGAHSGRISTDVGAAIDAGVPGTPVFHLFRDGDHRTEVVGNQNYGVFSNALEL
ncbi:DsbA family protein [Natronorarus salvus]|uniref:DsbA family protein n=1 Tax=Natronorarus salvus TaxID=3117733 RepID=UPI002F266335